MRFPLSVLFAVMFFYFNVPDVHLTKAAKKSPEDEYKIVAVNNTIKIRAGILERDIIISGSSVTTGSLMLDGGNLLDKASKEFSVSFHMAYPDAKPVGIKQGDVAGLNIQAATSNFTDILKNAEGKGFVTQSTQWTNILNANSAEWSAVFDHVSYAISSPKPGVSRLTIRIRAVKEGLLQDVFINMIYEVYDGFPAIRKWVEVSNNGPHWLKIDNLKIDDIVLAEGSNRFSDLTPSERGAGSCLRSFQNNTGTKGLIAGSEVPSALRLINEQGGMGYSPEYFEWVIGPAEKFTSEPVFIYGFSGEVKKTISGVSAPLDRAVERRFQQFLRDVIGVLPSAINEHVPLWCSWSNFAGRINDKNMREMADIASEAGFRAMEVSAGWGRTDSPDSHTENASRPDTIKFPDFLATSEYIRKKGLKLGIWLSCYRNPLSADLKALPDGYSLPAIKRGNGLAMSFASPWRYYLTNEMLYLHDHYGVTYIKQDLTNIKFGDIAASHESRTHKESLLRGLRGLLESSALLREYAPDVVREITHEIYWGTPGVPCDIAALKNVNTFHIPPNDYSGTGKSNVRYKPDLPYNADSLSKKLIEGCFNARKRFYQHRGLPLYAIEYYGAATFNFNGSLTERIQQRQVCSWLMGVPSIYAGDLASLTKENIAAYRKYFDSITELNRKYGIYNYFQYSGVPEPTDTDWHWWGKLNDQGAGAVIVLRGSGGEARRAVNIPWVQINKRYLVKLRFSERKMGVFTGKELIDGKLKIPLDIYGQEIIELNLII